MGKKKKKDTSPSPDSIREQKPIVEEYSVEAKELAEEWGLEPEASSASSEKKKLSHKAVVALCICGAGLASLLITFLVAGSTLGLPPNPPVQSSEPSSSPEEDNGAAETVTSTPDPTPTPTQTATPTPEPTPVPEPDFTNSVFIGSSTTEAMYIYGSLPDPDYLYATGLTVDSVFEETMPDSEVAIIDELNGKGYDKVFLSFGLNELGWPDPQVFIDHYRTVIEKIREYLPNAEIYIQSVLPVGIETSQRGRFGVTQDTINEYNILLAQMADEIGGHFLDVSTEFKGEDGYLPQDLSSDGIHPNKEGSDIWAQLIIDKVKETMV